MCGVVVYLSNIVKGLRTATKGLYGTEAAVAAGFPADDPDFMGREDSLRVMAASNTILALVLVGVLVLQAGQWYAQRKEEDEIAEMRRKGAGAKKTDETTTVRKGAGKKKVN